jgi:hypothetical protein
MPRVSLWFFAVAPVYVLIGMSLGIYMGASGDHSLYPAHAHMNLLGWVTLALFGTFYALARDASQKLAWTTFFLMNAGLIIMIPTLSLVLKFGELPQLVPPLVVSEFLAIGGMACFAFSVWGVLRRAMRDDARGAAFRPSAAE